MAHAEIREYVMAHAERGACKCGRCFDAPPNPEQHQPFDHTADLVFFEVSARAGADAETLKTLVRENKQGEFCEVDVLDGQEHSYIELGGWIGDQGMALMLMGLGAVLGIWNLLTPKTLLGKDAPADLVNKMAGQGFLSVQAKAS
jgi:hypothetical protein